MLGLTVRRSKTSGGRGAVTLLAQKKWLFWLTPLLQQVLSAVIAGGAVPHMWERESEAWMNE